MADLNITMRCVILDEVERGLDALSDLLAAVACADAADRRIRRAADALAEINASRAAHGLPPVNGGKND